ncbi:unnamed protein product [Trichogramma brassicae]|uniref:Uncharacterized protein n=1 Tax=Trichogramma brassicae TaxID=86971 RepID=A0A6H5J4S3_9HYME|nr:unnamed protein product [Trichogramma brassicae]
MDYARKMIYWRGEISWENEKDRRKFRQQLSSLDYKKWKGPLPDLREILQPEEIDSLLTEDVKSRESRPTYDDDVNCFVDLVYKTGYEDGGSEPSSSSSALIRTTPIHHAARRRYCYWDKTVRKLFKIYARFDVNYTDELGVTHFHVACEYGLDDVARKFLELGRLDPDCLAQRALQVDPPLHSALRRQHEAVVKLLLEAGADPNLASVKDKGSTPLHTICQERYGDLMELFFKTSEAKGRAVLVDARDESGRTTLHASLLRCHRRVSESLLRHGANPNLVDADGATAPHVVCKRNYDDELDLVEAIFEISAEQRRRVEVDARDKSGKTPLRYALGWGNRPVVESLLKRGADANLTDPEGFTALHTICANGDDDDAEQDELTRIVLESTREVDALDKLGRTPLHLALATGCKKRLVQALLDNGANANRANAEGSTPLHIVCRRDQLDDDDSAKMLLLEIVAQVDIDAKDKKGRNPLQWAVANLRPDLIDALLARGAAHLAGFVFPAEDYFGARFDRHGYRHWNEFKLKLACRALACVERLDERGYQLDRSDASTIVKFFTKYGVFEATMDLKRRWYDSDGYASKLKAITINLSQLRDDDEEEEENEEGKKKEAAASADLPERPSLSLYDLMKLPAEEAEKLLPRTDYLKFANSYEWWKWRREYREPCVVYLCETLSGGFLRRWAPLFFSELMCHQTPILCCKKVTDRLTCSDRLNVYLAAEILRKEEVESQRPDIDAKGLSHHRTPGSLTPTTKRQSGCAKGVPVQRCSSGQSHFYTWAQIAGIYIFSIYAPPRLSQEEFIGLLNNIVDEARGKNANPRGWRLQCLGNGVGALLCMRFSLRKTKVLAVLRRATVGGAHEVSTAIALLRSCLGWRSGRVSQRTWWDELMSTITRACDASMSGALYRRRREPAYWWNDDIAECRRDCIRARRCAQRARAAVLTKSYVARSSPTLGGGYAMRLRHPGRRRLPRLTWCGERGVYAVPVGYSSANRCPTVTGGAPDSRGRRGGAPMGVSACEDRGSPWSRWDS